MVADELDVAFGRVRIVMSDTARTLNMGGASGALGVSRSGMHLRSCAAEARRLLVEMAAKALAVPAKPSQRQRQRDRLDERSGEENQLCRID